MMNGIKDKHHAQTQRPEERDEIKEEFPQVHQSSYNVITDYLDAFITLDAYDRKTLKVEKTTSGQVQFIDYKNASDAIAQLKKALIKEKQATDLFGKEQEKNRLDSSLNTIYQTFEDKELYPSVEEKAANLLYFIVKNHPFVDGNKRIGAFIFIWFLDLNNLLYSKEGRKRIADDALISLTLLIAESKVKDKEVIINLIINLINKMNTSHTKLEKTLRICTLLDTLSMDFKDPGKYHLKQWYLGALDVLDNQNKPDRFSQAAYSLRELMEKLLMIKLDNYEPKDVENKSKIIEEFYKKIDPIWEVRSADAKKKTIKKFIGLRELIEDITHSQPDERPTSKEPKKHIEQSIEQSIKQLEEILLEFEDYRTAKEILIKYKNSIIERENKETKKILEKIKGGKPKEIVENILGLPKTNDPNILDTISNYALKIKPLEESIRLKDWVFAYSRVCLDPDVISNLIKYWAEKDINKINMGIELIKEIVFFEPDPKHDEKIGTWDRIQPRPKLRVWQYCEILREGVRSVSKNKHFEIASILIKATSNMLALEATPENREKGNDCTEIWCKNLAGAEHECKHMTPTESMCKLIQTLTFACEQAYKKETPSTIEKLDALLTKETWAFFKRLRCHLYSLNPNEQTKPKIKKLILDYKYHSEGKYGYEFQKMVRVACEHFDKKLLTKNERQNIFDIIFKGPSKEKFRRFVESHGESFKEEDFDKRKKYFHVRRFRPFRTVLLEQYENYYKELTATEDIIEDEYYKEKSGIINVITKSPIPKEILSQYTDQRLLDCINNYRERESYTEDENLIEIGIEGLAKEFETLFSESIINNTPKIDFWLRNLKNIKYSIYVRSIFEKISEDIKEGNFEPFDTYLKFYKKILPASNEEFRIEYYYSVVDFIEVCLSKDRLLRIKENCESLLELLCKLCTEYGFRISKDVIPTLTKEGNSIVDWCDAHGHARRRALSALIELGYWIRQYDTKADLDAITTVLEKRFNDKQHPLTLPERVTLAEEYRNIYILEQKWAMQNKHKFFPRDNLELFEKTFSQFLDTNQADIETFEIIRDELLFSISNLVEFKKLEDPFESLPISRDSGKLVGVLEEHLAYYYIHGAYPLEGEKSLLQEYYRNIEQIPNRGGEIFRTIGYLASNYEKDLEKKFKDYFNWRFQEKDKKELELFVPNWLEAKCLDIEWRLDSYSKILDIVPPIYADIQSMILKEMLPTYSEKVMECFAKLVRALKSHPDKGIEYCIFQERIEPILVTGLESNNKKVRQNAEQACKDLVEMDEHNWVSDLIEKYNVN